MGLTLIASSVLCTGNGANVWIEMKYKGLQKLEGMGRDVGAKLGMECQSATNGDVEGT